MEDEKLRKWLFWSDIIKTFFLVVLFITILCSVCVGIKEYKQKLDDLEQRIIKIEVDNKELWSNIDAISEDYSTLWINMYGEDSWYNNETEKQMVHNQLNSLEE